MKVCLCDNVSEKATVIFESEGFSVDIRGKLSESELIDIIPDIDAIVVRSGTMITEKVIAHAKKLKIIGRAGVGVDNIDIDAATRAGVVVMNTPLGNVNAAAELTMGVIFALARHIPRATQLMKEGIWDKKCLIGVELRGKTLGVVGMGHVGSIVARMANTAGMSILAYDPYLDAAKAKKEDVDLVTMEHLLKSSDFITIHAPLNASTRNLIDTDEFAMMKTGVYIINVGRGGIISERALNEAIKSGKVGGAAIDVWEKEPDTTNPLIAQDRVLALPHIGASTEEAQVEVAITVARQIVEGLRKETFTNAINMPVSISADGRRYLPYFHLTEQMGRIGLALVDGKPKEIRVDYYGDIATWGEALVTFALKGVLSEIMDATVNVVNASFIANQRGVSFGHTKFVTSDPDYTNYIRVRLVTDQGVATLGGTIFANKHPRVIEINDYFMEAKPIGHMLIIENEDVPGVVGKIGSILGEHQINVSEYRLVKSRKHALALSVINVVSDVPAPILDELTEISEVVSVRHVCV